MAVMYLYENASFGARQLNTGAIGISLTTTTTTRTDDTPRAFLRFHIDSESAAIQAESQSIKQEGDNWVQNPCFLALAVILLDIEMDEEVVVQMADVDPDDEKPSLFMAATRCNRILGDSGNYRIKDIVDRCLYHAAKKKRTPIWRNPNIAI